MGEKAPDALATRWAGEEGCRPLRRVSDPIFGEIALLRNAAGDGLVMARERSFASRQLAEEEVRALRARLTANHPALLRLLGCSVLSQRQLCASSYTVKAFYEHWPVTLHAEIDRRLKHSQPFPLEQVKALCFNVLEALRTLYARGVAHGDVRPQTIAYDAATGAFRLLERLDGGGDAQRMQVQYLAQRKATYASPQLWRRLHEGERAPAASPERGDLFSLGLTVLAVGTLRSVGDVYCPDGTVSSQRLQAHIARFASRFALEGDLVLMVSALLAEREEDRPDPLDPFSALPSYRARQTPPAQLRRHPAGAVWLGEPSSPAGGRKQPPSVVSAQKSQFARAAVPIEQVVAAKPLPAAETGSLQRQNRPVAAVERPIMPVEQPARAVAEPSVPQGRNRPASEAGREQQWKAPPQIEGQRLGYLSPPPNHRQLHPVPEGPIWTNATEHWLQPAASQAGAVSPRLPRLPSGVSARARTLPQAFMPPSSVSSVRHVPTGYASPPSTLRACSPQAFPPSHSMRSLTLSTRGLPSPSLAPGPPLPLPTAPPQQPGSNRLIELIRTENPLRQLEHGPPPPDAAHPLLTSSSLQRMLSPRKTPTTAP